MSWGHRAIALLAAFGSATWLDGKGIGPVGVVAAAVLAYLAARWTLGWLARTRDWVRYESRRSQRCPECGQRIRLLAGDWILTCHRCGWRAGKPGLRWLTRSVPAQQLKRTVRGPTVVVAVAAAVVLAGLLVPAVPAVVSEDGQPVVDGVEAVGSVVLDPGEDEPVDQGDDADPATTSDGKDDAGGTPTVPSTDLDPPPGPSTLAERIDPARVEELIFAQQNAIRAERGLGEFSWDDELDAAASAHAADMAEREFYNHTNPDGVDVQDRYDGCGNAWSENIAKVRLGQRVNTYVGTTNLSTDTQLAENLVAQWMASDGHRAAILGEYDRSAVAIEVTEYGTVYAVVAFCR